MDKGAHFFKCDFQVHTPRDARWSGGDAITDTERKAYAEELVRACRLKGLSAIAITDHHDLAFFPYIKKAARAELDDTAQPVPDSKKLVVFPGIELTLTAPNCQAILILDADFPENLLPSVLTALAINPAPSTDSKHAPVQRIPQNVVRDLSDLYEKLSSHEHIKGRFIVLPNVSETGHGTMLRTGFANFYKSMPCVGGYTDGPVSQFGTGNLSIVSGKNRDYGFKSIAVFQTSDNRKRDHPDLGKHTTWAKWSQPTAEALRQACLAKESRLSRDDPRLPPLWITSLSVSNSKFLSRVDIDFNPQYNAAIGGRGTGKSTILEYLRWGLCDQPVDDTESDIAPAQVKRKKLIEDTLRSVNGEVIVTFVLNGVRHILKRNSAKQEMFLKIADGDFAPTTEQEVRNLFPIQAYSQKQLSSVGVRVDELKRFVELPIKQSLERLRSEIRTTEAKMRSAYSNVMRKREIEAELAKYTLESASLTEQLGILQKSLKGLTEEEQKVIKQKALYDNEEIIIDNFKNALGEVEQLVGSLAIEFEEKVVGVDSALDTVNVSLIKSIREKYSAKFGEVRSQIKTLRELSNAASLGEINSELKKWTELKNAFDKKYEAAKANAKVNHEQLRQIQAVEKRITELSKLQRTHRNTLKGVSDAESAFSALQQSWNGLHAEKVEALDRQCQQFSALSGGLIRAEIRNSLDIPALRERIKAAFAGLNIKKVEDLCEGVLTAADPIATWTAILGELEKLSLHKGAAGDPLPATPLLDRCSLIPTEKTRIAKGLDGTKWIDLAVTELEFNPVFQYCTNKDTREYIAFADASAGQQATALLTVLLNQSGGPLIIDQPEDDVDSRMSPDIVELIWQAKSRRQLIFASHNANFVVNGDAELVVCCDYVRAGDQTGGQVKAEGAIDNANIRQEITAVTEGGEQAFKLRKEKYGF